MTASSDNVRAALVEALRLDLVGPDNNHPFAHELLPEPPSRWYGCSLTSAVSCPAMGNPGIKYLYHLSTYRLYCASSAFPDWEAAPEIKNSSDFLIREEFMLKPYFAAWICSVAVMVSGIGAVSGQTFNRPVRIVALPAGSGTDIEARLIAPALSASLGQPVLVDNRVGVTTAETVAKALPDGHTMLITGASFWIGTLLQKLSYDPARDFLPITIVSREANVVVVHPSLPVTNIKELIALAKAKPGQLNYGSGTNGSSTHLPGELFKSMAGVDIVRIPFKTSSLAVNDMLGGEGKSVQIGFWGPGGQVGGHIKSGRFRAIAVTSAEPSPLAPGLPTVAASGLPGYEYTSMDGIFVPAKTPDAIVKRLNQELVRFLHGPGMKEKFLSLGSEVVGSTPEELGVAMKADIARISKVIKDANIRLN